MPETEVMHLTHPQVTRFTACGGLFAEPGYSSVTQNAAQVTCPECAPFADGSLEPAAILSDARVLESVVGAVRDGLPRWLYPQSGQDFTAHYRLTQDGGSDNEVILAAHLMWAPGHSETLVGRYKVTVTVEPFER